MASYTKWHFCNIYETAKIGGNTKIGSYVEIGEGVEVGKNCMIESYVFIPEGITVMDNVFIGPRVTFTNDKYPPSNKLEKTTVHKGVRIGANATILPGITIGEEAVIGAGAVVVHDVRQGETVVGNPARPIKQKKKLI